MDGNKSSRRIFIVPKNIGIDEYVRFIIECLEKEVYFGVRIDELEALQKKLEEISLVLQKNRQSILSGIGLDILESSFLEMQFVMTYFRLIQDELDIQTCQNLSLNSIRQIELMARGGDISKRNKSFEKFQFNLGKIHRFIFPLLDQLSVARDFEVTTLASQWQIGGLKRTSRQIRKSYREQFENTRRLEKNKQEESLDLSEKEVLENSSSESDYSGVICFEDNDPKNRKLDTFANKKRESITAIRFAGKKYPWSKQEPDTG